MQAEFGNYDAERHTMECLQQCTLFPKVIKKIYKRIIKFFLFISNIILLLRMLFKQILEVKILFYIQLYVNIKI